MKSKITILVIALFLCGITSAQKQDTCDGDMPVVEDLNIIKYKKCLAENSSKKDKANMADRLQSQLHLKISSRSKKRRNYLRYSKKRKREVKSVIESSSLSAGVKSTFIPNEILFSLVDELPRFEDCNDNTVACFNNGLQRHFLENFHYPEQAVKNKIEGRVFVRFVIDKEGKAGNVHTYCSGDKKVLEDEVKRIVLSLPQLKAGKELGQNINVVYSMPIDFKL